MAPSKDSEGVEFDCPKCSHKSTLRSEYTGAFHVFKHFFISHGWYSFKVGCPLFDEDGPEFGGRES